MLLGSQHGWLAPLHYLPYHYFLSQTPVILEAHVKTVLCIDIHVAVVSQTFSFHQQGFLLGFHSLWQEPVSPTSRSHKRSGPELLHQLCGLPCSAS